MTSMIITYEPWLRLGCFVLIFGLLCWAEQKYTWRYILTSLQARWSVHVVFLMVSNFLVRVIFPVALVKMAYEVQYVHQLSLLQLPELQALPVWTHYVIGFVGLDLLMYWQHRIFHRIGLFWRLHLMHHTDKVLDASTGIRFHPLEYIFSMGFKMMGVILIGPPVMAVLIFEVVLNAASMFTHANIKLDPTWERYLRWFIVTPEMHRVHHSDIEFERDKNFGFFLSIWDRLLGTYLPFSRMSDQRIIPGVEPFWAQEHQSVWGMVKQPFYRKKKKRRLKKTPKMMRATFTGEE